MDKPIDISISSDKRATGLHPHKQPSGTNVTKVKRQALIDIQKECGKGKFFTINYVSREYVVLQLSKYNSEYIQL